jgi:tRNA threonylcarbamoyladenosine biosynthesis protein TsaE
MTNTSLKCNDVNDLNMVAQKLIDMFPHERIFLLSGKMGAGKTTLIKEICKALGVIDVVNSPTFSIVNEYTTKDGSSVFHFDLYRIKSPVELLDIGYEEYIYSDSVCLIEWPELAIDLMPSSYVYVHIEVDDTTGDRIFKFNDDPVA